MGMNPKENAMAIYNGEQPEYYDDFMAASITPFDPIFKSDSIPADGKEYKDSWGTVCIKPPNAPGKHPHITRENAVVKDVTKWKEQLVIPTLEGLDWSAAEAQVEAANRDETLIGYFSAQGLFERSHFLMGMEDALCAYLEEPEAMAEMLRAIADYKIAAIHLAAQHLHPDFIFFQDDWGTKKSLFLPPDVWREIIKPLHTEIVQAAHDEGMIFVHHNDSYGMPLVEDMVDMGIDIWQGVIPQNDIVDAQKRTNGKLAIIGGIDGAMVDSDDTTEEQIRAEVRRAVDTYCPGGRFYPAAPGVGKANPDHTVIMQDELDKYSRQWAKEHPIAS